MKCKLWMPLRCHDICSPFSFYISLPLSNCSDCFQLLWLPLTAIGVASSTVVSQQGPRSSLTLVGGTTSPPHTPLHCTGGVASSVSSPALCCVQRSSSGAGVHHRVLHLRASVSQSTSVTLISLYHRVSFDLPQAHEPGGV